MEKSYFSRTVFGELKKNPNETITFQHRCFIDFNPKEYDGELDWEQITREEMTLNFKEQFLSNPM